MSNLPPHIPPKHAEQFLTWFVREELAEEVLGDLEEKFYSVLDNKSPFRAKLNYWYQVANYLRPFAIRNPFPQHFNHIGMYRHYFKISWRNLSKQKMYSFIKIGGLALGVAACFLITLFVNDELKYDDRFSSNDPVFRVLTVGSDTAKIKQWTSQPAPFSRIMTENFPEIEKVGRLIPQDWFDGGDNQVRPLESDQNNYESGFMYADQSLLEILEIPFVHGDPLHALTEPNSVVISKRKADKYFPNENPVGKVFILNEVDSIPYTIGGVMENLAGVSHFQADFLLSLSEKEFWEGEQNGWCCFNYDVYTRLKPGVDSRQLAKKLSLIRDDYMIRHFEKEGDDGAVEFYQTIAFDLQPVRDIYLKSIDTYDNHRHGDIRIVWTFGIIAAFILLLACINFINLSTAKSANRAKEVGLRKVVGSFRSSLVKQFLTESIIFSFLAFGAGILIAWLLLPYFNELADKTMVFPWREWWLAPTLLGFAIFTGILAGIYPAIYLSGFTPIDVLKGSLSRGSKGSKTRGALVVFQFTTSIVLIICTLVTYQQMQFILNKDLGFDRDQVIMLQGANTMKEKQFAFKDALRKFPEVKHITASEALPVSGTKRDNNTFWREGRKKKEKGVGAQIWFVDSEYTQTLGMKIVAGRGFSREMTSDSGNVLINQTMVKKMGFEHPIGERITNFGTFTIIGVVEDFHFESLKHDIRGSVLALGNTKFGYASNLSIKVNTEDMEATLEKMTGVWDEMMPHQPIRYTFLDERYEQMYGDVKRTGNIFTSFAGLAIIVACLGLFALSAFMVEQRRKEISIRKILGASFSRLFNLLTANFLKWVLISLLLAIPIGWFAMHSWLEDYTHRIDITAGVFFFAGILTIAIAILTISFETIRVVRMNPADNLRSE